MEDKELKKKLRKVPDVDEAGEPIWKIERQSGEKQRQANARTSKSGDRRPKH